MLVTLVGAGSGRRSTWRVIDKRGTVAFSDQAGPWLLLVPAGRPPSDRAARWVHALLDRNFKVMPGEGVKKAPHEAGQTGLGVLGDYEIGAGMFPHRQRR